MQKSIIGYTLILAAFFTFAIFTSYTSDKNDAGNTPNSTSTSKTTTTSNDLPQIIKPVNLDKAFSFAGEVFPMENFDVKERLDRELLRNTYWHSNTLLNIKKAYKYFPVIEKILAENGVPDDFKYLSVAESDLSNAVSPAGAKGFWQFMKKTGAYYDLEINSQIDERYHLEKATQAFCKYIKSDYKRFNNSWLMAAAAYNMGGTRLSKRIKEQRAKSYFDLNLNQETSRYVFRLVAIKEIMNNPRDFGFYASDHEKYQPLDPNNYKTIEVNYPVSSWAQFAEKHNTNYRMLKVLNPWLITPGMTNKSGTRYVVKVPR